MNGICGRQNALVVSRVVVELGLRQMYILVAI